MSVVTPTQKNILYYGDNLDILQNLEYFPSESVDLIYLDPPFNSNQNYNLLFKDESGRGSEAQITVFGDTWHWGPTAEKTFAHIIAHGTPRVAQTVDAIRRLLGQNQMLAYLVMMSARLIELQRVLKPTGSLYLHCDTTASHYLKILLDSIFGAEHFLNEITWKRTTAHNDSNRYGRIQDRLLFYSKSDQKTFNAVKGEYSDKQMERYKYADDRGRYRAENLTAPHFSPTRTVEWRGVTPGANRQWRYSIEELEHLYKEGFILLQRNGKPRKDGLKTYLVETSSPALQDIWTDIVLGPTAKERLGYPTQKPVSLLERIILASSNPGDVVLDPFCGCGTAIAAAQKLDRRWIGIDVTHLSVAMQKYRLQDQFDLKPGDYAVIGEPKDIAGARAMAKDSENDGRYQFQWWALSLVRAKPFGQATQGARKGKKGRDKGVDGLIYFLDDSSGRAKEVLVQVKSGSLNTADIREFRGTMEGRKSEIGVFIMLDRPTRDMLAEAAAAGMYTSEHFGDFPRLQILSIEDLMKGATVQMPRHNITFKKAERVKNGAKTMDLFDEMMS